MKRRVGFAAVVVVVLAFASLVPAGGSPPAPPDEPDAFAGKIIYVTSRPVGTDPEAVRGIFEKVRVARLGDRSFLVGAVVDVDGSPTYKAAAGTRVWTPMSDVVQLMEFDNLDDLKRYFGSMTKGAERVDR